MKRTNLAIDVEDNIRLHLLPLKVLAMEGVAGDELEAAYAGCKKLYDDLTNPKILFEHVLNADITGEEELHDLLILVAHRIRKEAGERK